MSSLLDFGIELIVSIQEMLPGWDGSMNFVTFFGTIDFYMILIPLIFWTISKPLGLGAMLMLAFTAFIGESFKLSLHQPRPYWISDKVQLLQSKGEPNYGIISTHASNPPALLGYLVWKTRKKWLLVLAILVPLVISFSRLYLGVHFPHDILAGWLLAIIMLYLAIRFEGRIADTWKALSTGQQVFAGLLVSMAMLLIAVLISMAVAGSPDPESYAAYASEAREPDIFVTLAGLILGATAGWALMNRYACFSTRGSLLQKAGRFLLGMVGMVLFLEGLGYLFDLIHVSSFFEQVLRFVRYGSVALWGIFGAPWVFLKLKLAQPEE